MPIRSIRALSLLFLSALIIATIGTGAGIYFSVLHMVDGLVDQRIADMSEEIAPNGTATDIVAIKTHITSAASARETADLGYILWQNGRQVAGNVRIGRDLPRGYTDVDVRHHIAGLTIGRSFTRDLGHGLDLSVIGETEPIDHYHHWQFRIYLLGFAAIILVGAIATYVLSTTLSRRIAAIRQTADAIAKGDLAQRVPAGRSGNEFDQLAWTFNQMLGRLEEFIAEIRNMSNTVAHELRTPLTRLRNQLSLVVDNPDAFRVRSKVAPALHEADELLGMFSSLLKIADAENGGRHKNFSRLDLSEVAADCADSLRPAAEEAGHVLTWQVDAGCYLEGDRSLIVQMIVNLIENAIRHTPAQTRVDIILERMDDELLLTVVDNGPGIATHDRTTALRRFGRLEPNAVAGHGLGLSLVEAVVRLHGGTMEMADAAPGLAVKIAFPLSK